MAAADIGNIKRMMSMAIMMDVQVVETEKNQRRQVTAAAADDECILTFNLEVYSWTETRFAKGR
jgi:hypothetical protein